MDHTHTTADMIHVLTRHRTVFRELSLERKEAI